MVEYPALILIRKGRQDAMFELIIILMCGTSVVAPLLTELLSGR